MGKLIPEESPTTMTTKIIPTNEQLRLAVLCMEKPDDHAVTKEKCQEMVKLTGCAEETALVILHECDNVFEVALNKILDNGSTELGWQTSSKKAKKSHNHGRGDAENSQSTASQQVMNNNNINICNGGEIPLTQNEDACTTNIGDYGGSRFNNNGAGGGVPRKRAQYGGGFNNRDSVNNDSRLSRGRGRGISSRGGRPRGRGGFNSIDHNSGDTEHSTERTDTRPRGMGRRGGFQNDYRGGGRNGARGGPNSRRHYENSDTGFHNGTNTWSNETESNTWDNSMAGKWGKSNDNHFSSTANQDVANDGGIVVDEWKNNNNNTKGQNANNCNGDNNNGSSNTWDNSMAQGVVHQSSLQQRRSKDGTGQDQQQQHRSARTNENYNRHQHNKHASNKVIDATHNVNADLPPAEDWNHDDWTGEEVDWQKMNRVYVNMANQQQLQAAKNAQQSQTAGTIPSSSQSLGQQVSNTNNSSSSFVSNTPQQHDHKQPTVAVDSAGVASHIRGESIDVKLLLGQQKTTKEAVNDFSSGSWNKQATDAIKNELGIGKIIPSNADQLPRNTRQYATSKPATSRVEMPSSVPLMGKIDVEFGEFTSSLKIRPGADEPKSQQQQQKNYYEFGTATSYVAADMGHKTSDTLTLNTGSQTTAPSLYQRTPSKEQQGSVELPSLTSSAAPSSISKDNAASKAHQKNIVQQSAGGTAPVDMLYGAGSVASNSFIRSAANSAPEQYQAQSQQQQQQTQTQPSIVSSSRSPSILPSAQSQTKSQQTMGISAQQSVNQQQHPQRTYISSGVQSSMDSSGSMSQISKESVVNPSMIALPSTQCGLNYSNVPVNRTVSTSGAGKQQLNPTTIFNPATNASYQALAAAAAMPYIYPAAADQSYLNALQFLSPAAAAAGYPFNALGTLPFDLASLNLRDTQQAVNAGSSDGKQYVGGRSDVTISGANASINAPPGLGPATVQNAEQQAAQLLTPAAAAAFPHPYQLMQAPFYTPFVVPTVTNSSASTVNTANQYKNFASAQPCYYGSADMQLAQDYTKNMYSMSIAAQPTNQNKQSGGANLNMNANDVTSKGYSAASLKIFDGKSFQQNTATPPPGMGNVAYPPGAAAYSSNANAAAMAAAYGPYAQFLPHQISMLPPNIAAQAQAVNPGDVLNNAGGQRGTNAGNKAGSNVYAATKNNAYWAN